MVRVQLSVCLTHSHTLLLMYSLEGVYFTTSSGAVIECYSSRVIDYDDNPYQSDNTHEEIRYPARNLHSQVKKSRK